MAHVDAIFTREAMISSLGYSDGGLSMPMANQLGMGSIHQMGPGVQKARGRLMAQNIAQKTRLCMARYVLTCCASNLPGTPSNLEKKPNL